MSEKIKLDFSVSFSEIINLNPNFSMAKMKVAYVGRNRNMSDISKEVFIDAIPTIFNCPIVARYDRETNQFGSHDIEVVIDDKTKEIKIVNATTPFGVIPESAKWYFEEIQEANGSINEYLIVDVILWRRQEGYEHLIELESIDESMEVDFIKQHIDNEGYCVAEKMCFSAFCLLETAKPCFESASVQMFSEQINDNYKLQFSKMVEDFKDLMKEQSNKIDFSINITYKGGENELILTQEKITEILTEYEIIQDDLDFEITKEMTEEDFRLKLDGFKEKYQKCSKAETYATTYLQKRQALENACDTTVERNENDEVISSTYYWVQDFDDTYVYVEKNYCSDDNQECTYGRFAYTYDATENTATLTSDFELMILARLTVEENEKLERSRNAFELLEIEFEDYKKEYSTPNEEANQLKEFKKARISEDHKLEVNAVLDEFEDLKEIEEFIGFKEKAEEFENIEDLKEKCYAIRGKNTPVKFSAKPNKPTSIKLPIGSPSDNSDDEPYGDIFNEYGKRK